MIPDAVLILSTVKVGFEFGVELLRYLQTAEGQKFAQQLLADRKAWDAFWANAASGISTLFKGDLFK